MSTGITMSKSMKKKLPAEEQDGILDLLWAKSAGLCWLCQGTLNRAADTIVADHEVPESEGGPTELANLNLAHSPCNSAKRAARTMDVRPYLRLVAYANKRRLKYDGYLKHFEIDPAPVVISRRKAIATLELPNGDVQECPIFTEETAQQEFEYIFVSLPRNSIFNDDDCQPRAIRPEHAWAIYGDLQRNPLHEPPSCRTETGALERPTRLLMFDGQHKTIATWMAGRNSVTAKVYLNLSSSAANELVNSIQAKIKKLPLSPFELAGKMSDEWQNKFHEYEKSVGSTDISEKGFVDWLPSTERARGKQALQGALVQGILGDESLRITRYVKKPSGPREPIEITEQALKTKIIEGLLIKDPQRARGNEAQAARDREAQNIIACLNRFSDLALEIPEGLDRTPQDAERGRRMVYQGSLAYISKLIRELWFHIACRSAEKNLMDDEFDETQWNLFQEGMQRMVDHPIWTAPWEDKEALKSLQTGLEKNQASKDLFEELGLSLTHLVMGIKDQQFRKHWC